MQHLAYTNGQITAFQWITGLLKKLNIPYQITGGLAARTYGSNRELDDIDIDIPEEQFYLIRANASEYIVFGPEQYKSEQWDLFLMTLDYHGQQIDLGGAYKTKIFNQKTQRWVGLSDDFAHSEIKSVMGVDVPVITKDKLIAYKTILSREVDILDINNITQEKIYIREPKIEDAEIFVSAMQQSKALHHPWTRVPLTQAEFVEYLQRYQQANQKSFLALTESYQLVGVFNISEIVRGYFQNAYLGFYATAGYAGKGLMSQALKLVLQKIFNEIKLHRVEANIQPENSASINLVKNNGFKKEGFSPRYLQIDGQWRDHERWALTVEDYES